MGCRGAFGARSCKEFRSDSPEMGGPEEAEGWVDLLESYLGMSRVACRDPEDGDRDGMVGASGFSAVTLLSELCSGPVSTGMFL